MKENYSNGWPNKIKEENETNHFYKLRSDLTIEDELIYSDNRVVIPKTLRIDMLKKLHESHQGAGAPI